MATEWPTHRRKAAQKRPDRKRVLAEIQRGKDADNGLRQLR